MEGDRRRSGRADLVDEQWRIVQHVLDHPSPVRLYDAGTWGPHEAQQLEKLAQSYGLGKTEQWVFADPQPEKLRFEIDRRWYGELPRTYFFNAKHRREGHSGVIPLERLESWVGEHVK